MTASKGIEARAEKVSSALQRLAQPQPVVPPKSTRRVSGSPNRIRRLPVGDDAVMRVVGLVTQKGGSGKSTTGASLAVMSIERGFRVFLLELDSQGTWNTWITARANNDNADDIDFETIEASQLPAALAAVEQAGYELAFFNTPGTNNPAVNEVMRLCQSCLYTVPADSAGHSGLRADR